MLRTRHHLDLRTLLATGQIQSSAGVGLLHAYSACCERGHTHISRLDLLLCAMLESQCSSAPHIRSQAFTSLLVHHSHPLRSWPPVPSSPAMCAAAGLLQRLGSIQKHSDYLDDPGQPEQMAIWGGPCRQREADPIGTRARSLICLAATNVESFPLNYGDRSFELGLHARGTSGAMYDVGTYQLTSAESQRLKDGRYNLLQPRRRR